MKALILAATIFAALPLPQAHAFRHDCVEQKAGAIRLEFHTFSARGSYNLDAELTNADQSKVFLNGKGEIDPVVNGYSLTDREGNAAFIRVFTRSAWPKPLKCGRAGCDFDGEPQTIAVLKYLGTETDFACP